MLTALCDKLAIVPCMRLKDMVTFLRGEFEVELTRFSIRGRWPALKSVLIMDNASFHSMFRWYHNAAKCYVYLKDVSTYDQIDLSLQPWEAAFRNSR